MRKKLKVSLMYQVVTVALLSLLLPISQANAIGIIVPRVPDVATPRLVSVDISGEIKSNIARTRITQVYKNNESRPVEADFYFPVPDGADITDFVLYMNGKPVKGEVLAKDKAHDIYRDIVRKLKDPGLVEWADKNLFRVRVFPIPAHGEQKLEIELSQPLTSDQGYFRYTLPMESGRHPASADSTPDMHLKLNLESDSPIRNVYSPTHDIDTSTSSGKTVTVTSKGSLNSQSKNFILYYEQSNSNIAVSLLTHKEKDSDGYFTLRISPPWDDQSSSQTASQSGDYVFVIDTSGSMAQSDKISQAQKALKYCVGLLSENDRFNLVNFSTTVQSFKEELIPATSDNRKAAVNWTTDLKARGGTNISEAIKTALKQRKDAKTGKLFTVVFITDGLPTVGQTSPDEIIKSAQTESGGNVRIFTFGVGNDVNTRLLDSLANETRAASDYVSPDTDLEVPISRFFDKVSRPALFNVELSIPKAGTSDIYPVQLPDLFYGTELAVFGRYKNPGNSPIILTGTIAGEKKEYRFEKDFAASTDENPFIEKLWATRKVAWLVDEVRKSGESDELRKEIEELANKYSIVTPYTSFLAMEDEAAPIASSSSPRRPGMLQSRHLSDARLPTVQGDIQPSAAPAVTPSYAGVAKKTESYYVQSESGALAVQNSQRLSQMKSADNMLALQSADKSESSNQKSVGGKTFTIKNGVWTDSQVTGTEKEVIKVRYMSNAWFHISDDFPKLRDFFALGESVTIKMDNGSLLKISPDGIENIEVKDLKRLGLELKKRN